jgi:glycosyltransferase involved in cell wall biosynthesis
MRFVFISTMAGAPWGGSEELWSQAALRLQQQGHEVSASVAWWPELSPRVEALAGGGIELFVRKPASHSLASRVWRKIKRQFREEIPAERQWLLQRKPDLAVISQGGNSCGLFWMNYCREQGLPFAAIVQANFEGWWPDDKRTAKMARAYHAARHIFCVSRHNLELLEKQIGESLPNALVIRNPFNVSASQPPAWPKENGAWKLACVARLEPAAKGQDLLFQILAQPKWQERPVEVNLYGTGPCEQNLKKLANHFQLKNVRFRGHVTDVAGIWEENHLLVLPSRYEGLPLALVEAMWRARPAVVTDIGGSAEMCVDGETGFVAGAPAIKLLEETLEHAWNKRNDWPRMGLAARARAEKLIPKDPVENFCKQLLECAEKQKSES